MTYHLNKLKHYNQGHSPVYAYYTKAFTDEEVDKIIEIGEKQELQEAEILLDANNKKIDVNDKVRITDVSWIERTEDTAWLFNKLEYYVNYLNDMFYNFELTNYESLQYTLYNKKGSHYDWHVDAGYNIVEPLNRKLSLSLFLTEKSEYMGGDFEYKINANPVKINEDAKGSLIVFPSHVLHRVTPVTKGVRKSLVMWTQGPHFK
jgi:PKHD-type hydroxylase